MNKKTLLIGFHSNLPDFINIDTKSVFDEHASSISNIFDKVKQFKNLKINIHLTKNIVKHLDNTCPSFYSTATDLLQNNQLELLSGGLYEPLFPLIPKEDREIQIKLMNRYLNHSFGATPTGGWIPGFAWETSLASDFSKARINYSFLPESYFLNSGVEEKHLNNYYVTEDEGRKLSIFPINFELTELISNHSPEDVLNKITNNDHNCQTIFYNGPYINNNFCEWLIKFFDLINLSETHKTELFNTQYSTEKPNGRIYISCSDSIDSKAWKHSLIKYPEANILHKKMLRVSKKISAAKEGKSRFKVIKEMIDNAHDLMLKGQRNNFYWDTFLGGIYSPFDRFKAYSRLIEAENLIEQASKQKENKMQLLELDYDCDGNDEIIIETETQNIYISPESGGTILEHDYKEKNINIINTMSRKPEEYITDGEYNARIRDFMKANLIDRFFEKEFHIEDCITGKVQDLFIPCLTKYEIEKVKTKEQTSKVSLFSVYQIHDSEIKLTKSISAKCNDGDLNISYEIFNQGSKEVNILYGTELNYNLTKSTLDNLEFKSSTGTSNAYTPAEVDKINSIELTNNTLGIGLNLSFSRDFKLFKYPIETYLKKSDKLIEKTFQGITFLPVWELNLKPGEKIELNILQRVSNLNPQIKTKDSETFILNN